MLKGHITNDRSQSNCSFGVWILLTGIFQAAIENEKIISSSLLQTINIPIFAIVFVFVNRCG
jgi:hypothetical protein